MVLRVLIEPEKGGVHEFSNYEEAIEWANLQNHTIDTFFSKLPAASLLTEVKHLAGGWYLLAEDIRLRFEDNPEQVDNDEIRANKSVMLSSSVAAEALYAIGNGMGDTALRGALYAAGLPIDRLDWQNNETIAGMLVYRVNVENTRGERSFIPLALQSEIDSFNDGIHDLKYDIAEAKSDISSIETSAKAGLEAAENRLKSLTQSIEEESAAVIAKTRSAQAHVESMASVSQLALTEYEKKLDETMEDTTKRLNDWIEAQKQAAKLATPVELWNQRSASHEKASIGLGKVALGSGILGTLFTPIVAWLSFLGAKRVLSDATLERTEAVKATASGIRPTLNFELIFAATTTLFWLTMFFWLMRLLVKRYTGEQRMGIDASGRSAMAETYVGFVAEGAAGEKERPIVVEALFRPVTADGKSDDGPPTISVPAVFSSLLQGKS